MSARDELIERVMESIDVMDWHVTEEVWERVRVEATVFVDAFAHELAEEIYRAQLPEARDNHWVRFGMNIAGHLIDPEATQ